MSAAPLITTSPAPAPLVPAPPFNSSHHPHQPLLCFKTPLGSPAHSKHQFISSFPIPLPRSHPSWAEGVLVQCLRSTRANRASPKRHHWNGVFRECLLLPPTPHLTHGWGLPYFRAKDCNSPTVQMWKRALAAACRGTTLTSTFNATYLTGAIQKTRTQARMHTRCANSPKGAMMLAGRKAMFQKEDL